MFPNLEIKRGMTFSPITLSLEEEDGSPINLSGWSAFADVCFFPSAPAAFSLNPEITVPNSGIIVLAEIAPTGTMALRVGNYTWDLVLQNPAGQRLGPYVEGRVTVSSVNTKP